MRTKKYRGGSNGNDPSAWSYVYNTVGDGMTQFRNALTLQPGTNLGSLQSNDIEPIGNLNAQNVEGVPTSSNLSLIQKAGKRRRRRGGNMVAIANQALVPISLIAMQQGYSKRRRSKRSKGGRKSRKSKSKKTRKSRKSRR
jgi:hypothetical protein